MQQETPPEQEEITDGLEQEHIQSVIEAVEAQDSDQLNELLEPLHAADVADLIEQISQPERVALVELWGDGIDGEVLSELHESVREPLLEVLPSEVVADAIRDLDSDDVVELVEDLEEEHQSRLLEALEIKDRIGVEGALSYPEYSAGRLMQRELVAVPEDWSVGQAIDYIRGDDSLPAQFYHVILVSPAMKPVGYITLGRLLSSRRQVPLADITEPSFRTVSVTEEASEVAYLFNHYHLISTPVIDENGRLVGMITIDDAMTVLDEEHEEDMLRMAGVDEDSSLADTVWQTTRGRAVWLMVNLMTAIFASMVINLYAETINQMVALAVLMPIVASMGGNAGTQTMTVAVRAIATRELTSRNALRVSWREITVGAINGVGFGIVMALVAAFWFGIPMLGAVIALAMAFTLVAAALGGIVIPIMLERFNIDPALASGPFVTTVTDVVGFFAFLGLASLILL
ncbi:MULTISPECIES: magnesium transporter [unclassified Wenzhouxiangella]|uniref:magnesium transporter n=1 Tax=unclassified Wenzhouxiangella TaxID=2613841 RepID=UPI000E325D6D|nr:MULTISPECIES: magnesium transporter [unclassified Wenzhouxiangella]RFF27007.1 magnesium transporter [Wenzhouxiangella sp. 15181]RFP69518.1 magnesium transporter [Wenzhouxiangella sp. 15190]